MTPEDRQIRALVAELVPAHAGAMETARGWLRQRLPAAHEVAYEYRDAVVISYSPNANGYDAALALRVDAKGVSLYFNFGKLLADPAKLLKGSARQVRFIVLDDATLARREVVALVDEAVARSAVPYPTTGRGPVSIRATAAAQRRQPRPA